MAVLHHTDAIGCRGHAEGSPSGPTLRASARAPDVRAAAFLLAGCLLATAATAQTTDADILTYAGPDRTDRLIEGAKKEGELTY